MKHSAISLLLVCIFLCTVPALAIGPYTDNGDTVIDKATGLEWQQGSNLISYNWQGALAYCEGLDLAGNDDWRLPNIRELNSLVDAGRYNPAIDPVFKTASFYYLSATTHASYTDYAWVVDFRQGKTIRFFAKGYNGLLVRCVRGGLSKPPDSTVVPITPTLLLLLLDESRP